MKPFVGVGGALAALFALGGCAPRCDTWPEFVERGPWAPAVLFDPSPGPIAANELIYRADWPAAETRYEVGETVYYREYFFDEQGTHGRNRDHTYRQFTTYRSGASVR